jgi:hypothetical protein
VLSSLPTDGVAVTQGGSTNVEKGSLSVIACLIASPPKGRGQTDDPPIGGGCSVFRPSDPSPVEYSRRTQLIWELTPTSAMDFDFTPWGIEENLVVIVGWTDFGAGGEFGYSPDGQTFFPESDPERVNCYRPNPEFVGVLRIAPILDDIPIGISSGEPTYDDPVTVGDPWTMTIWEFWITDGAHGWVPALDSELTFTAWIEPSADHKGQRMARSIVFLLSSSAEPGYCMNATRISGRWDDTVGPDLKFIPFQQGIVFYGDNAVRTQGSVINFTVRVICLDYGAHSGSLMAYAPIAEKNEPARLYRDGNWVGQKYYAPIPWDENNNFISDFSSYNVYHKGWYDSETSPIGDGTFGDGFSVYEEYRGVEVDGPTTSGWIRLDPEKKEMFVWLDPNQFNSAEFFPGSGMPVVYLLDSRPGKNRVDPNQRVNYNVDYNSPTINERHRRDAYAAWLIDGGFHPEVAGLTIGPIWLYNWFYKLRCYIFTQTIAQSQRDPMINPLGHTFDEVVKFVIGHELGHTVLWHQWDGGHHDPRNPDHDELCLMWPWIPWHLGHYSSVCFLPTEFCEAAPNPRCQFRWKLVE